MKQHDWYKNLDFWGLVASMTCAVHCALLPIFVTFSLAGNFSIWADPLWEHLFLGASGIFAIASLVPGLRTHESWRPIILATLGFTLILGSHLHNFTSGHLHVHEKSAWLAAIGGLFVAGAHWMNWKILRSCCSTK
ncbi:MAG: MerC domain-containing protein [Bacteroidota bacterium]